MARISFTDTDGTLRWFDPEAAQATVSEGTRWDGNVWRGVISDLQTAEAILYLTKGGRWIENRDATREYGGSDVYRYLTDTEARSWLVQAADAGREDPDAQATLDKHFGELEEESGPSAGGRPKIGPPINVAYPTELLARIEAAAKRDGVNRADWLRQVATAAVADSEQRAANPTEQ
jgi:hypothetical protein